MIFLKALKRKLKKYKEHRKLLKKIKCARADNEICINPQDIEYIVLDVQGKNNKITIAKLSNEKKGKIKIRVFGDNCTIKIEENLCVISNLTITLGQNHSFHGKIKHTFCSIGKNVRMEDVVITTYNSNNQISIGNDCLFSLGVCLYNTDGHPIYDVTTGKLLNYVSDMTIGHNCWIGYKATLLKGTVLPNGTIVGWGSVVCKKFTEENTAIAGNPAKIIRRNLLFKRGGDIEYINNERGL